MNGASRGRVVTTSDLKEVLKAKTEEKDRHKGGEERSYHGESYYSRECPVRKHTNTHKKKLQKTLPENYFLFVFDLGAFQEESLFGCCERATVMLL